MVTIRLSRTGRKKISTYRVVVTDQRKKRDGRIIEWVGNYEPKKREGNATLKKDRIEYWLSKGARPSETVSKLIKDMAKSA
jgi:small subunit ribosomal protein S16